MKRKWTYREYYVHDNTDIEHKYVKMYCNINQFSEFSFCDPHFKPHGARGLGKNYTLRHDVLNVDHKMIMLGIGLCYNTFSHICVQHQHYPKHDTICLFTFFPLIVFGFFLSITPYLRCFFVR